MNKWKKSLKNKNGITLIALVISIIILLILATVTILALTGENGLFTRAKEARDETRASTILEQIALWKTNNVFDQEFNDRSEDKDTFLARLVRDGLLSQDESDTLVADGTITVGKTDITLNSPKRLVDAVNDEEVTIGSYVQGYTPNNTISTVSFGEEETGVNETQTYSVNTNTKWRILGVSEDKEHVLLTSADPLKKTGDNPYLKLAGAQGYINCVDVLDEICGIYNNSELADRARSITIEDINHILGITADANLKKVYKTSDSEKTDINTDYFRKLGDTFTYYSGMYAPENYLKEKYPSNTKYSALPTRSNGSTITYDGYEYSITGETGPIYNILFAGTTWDENNAKAYWLVAPSSFYVYNGYAGFGPGSVANGMTGKGNALLFSDQGSWYERRLAVRPVIVLKSGVTVDEFTITPSVAAEADWTTNPGNPSTSYLSETTGKITE